MIHQTSLFLHETDKLNVSVRDLPSYPGEPRLEFDVERATTTIWFKTREQAEQVHKALDAYLYQLKEVESA